MKKVGQVAVAGAPTPLRALRAARRRVPAAPASLGPAGRALWRGIMREYELDETHQRAILETACQARDRVGDARRLLRRDGMVTTTSAGSVKSHPALAAERNAQLVMLRAIRELGLDLAGETSARPPSRWG